MGKLTLRVAVAFFAFVVGVASASLYVVRHYRDAKEAPSLHPVSVPERLSRPEGWQKIGVGNKFSFHLPPDMQKQVESIMNVEYIGTTEFFTNKALAINYGYVEKRHNEMLWNGRMSCEAILSGLADRPGYRSSEVEIGGRRARQIFWQSDKTELGFTTLCFPDVGDGTILRFGAVSKDERALDVAQQIFGSIEFP